MLSKKIDQVPGEKGCVVQNKFIIVVEGNQDFAEMRRISRIIEGNSAEYTPNLNSAIMSRYEYAPYMFIELCHFLSYSF